MLRANPGEWHTVVVTPESAQRTQLSYAAKILGEDFEVRRCGSDVEARFIGTPDRLPASQVLAALATLAPEVEVTLHHIAPMDAVAAFPMVDWEVSETSASTWLTGYYYEGDRSVTVNAWPVDWTAGDTNRAACLAAVEASRQMSGVAS
jgi:hypothetical protein